MKHVKRFFQSFILDISGFTFTPSLGKLTEIDSDHIKILLENSQCYKMLKK